MENIKKPINRKEGDAKSHLTSHSSKSGKIIASHDSTKTSDEEIIDKLTAQVTSPQTASKSKRAAER